MSAGDLLTNMSKYKPNKENTAPFDYTKKQKQNKINQETQSAQDIKIPLKKVKIQTINLAIDTCHKFNKHRIGIQNI